MVRTSYASCSCAWDCAFPPRSHIPSFVRRSVLFGKLRRVLLLLLPPPGTGELTQPSQARPSGAAPEGLGTARFTKAVEMKERRSARCPRVAALVQRHPQNHRPGQLAAHIALGITWGGLVGLVGDS